MQLNDNTQLQDGKYRIVRMLGQGGFGITYLAENVLLGRMVAIKEFFPKDFCGRDNTSHLTLGTQNNAETVAKLKARFLKEARNIARLDHPGIVKIHDVFEENNTAYYVMDYIDGENLNQIVKRSGALTERKAVEYIRKVADALDYIHSRNMTHFDVKPANIMVRRADDQPILIDFGLSKQYDRQGDATSTLMQAVSQGYSPIELYNASGIQTFSPQTDIYSLGATLYFLVTGSTPPEVTLLISGVEKMFFPPSISINIVSAINSSTNIVRTKRCKNVSDFVKILGIEQAYSIKKVATKVDNTNSKEETVVLHVNDAKPIINFFRRTHSLPVYEGTKTQLEWSVDDAESISVNGEPFTVNNGKVLFAVDVPGKMKFELIAQNKNGATSRECFVDVLELPQPRIRRFEITNNGPFFVGDRVNIDISVTFASEVFLDGEKISSSESINYDVANVGVNEINLTAKNKRHTITKSITIHAHNKNSSFHNKTSSSLDSNSEAIQQPSTNSNTLSPIYYLISIIISILINYVWFDVAKGPTPADRFWKGLSMFVLCSLISIYVICKIFKWIIGIFSDKK